MRKRIGIMVGAAAATLIAAAPALFQSPTESRWTVTSAGKPLATVTLLTDGRSARAEWKPSSPGATVVFLGANQKLWVRGSGGDIEYASHKGGIEKNVLPALLLPFTTSAADKVDSKSGKVSSYSYGSTKASYQHDAHGPSSIEVTAGGSKYTLTRSTFGKPAVNDPNAYVVRPKKTAASQLAAVAGDIFGPSDTKVSATAGARGVGRGKAFADGGDYGALEQLEIKVDEGKAKVQQALGRFQKEGKVGKAREE